MKRLAILAAVVGFAIALTGCRTGRGYARPQKELREDLKSVEAEKEAAERELARVKAEKTVEVPVAPPGELTEPKEPSIVLDVVAVRHLLDGALGAAKKKDVAGGTAILDRATDALQQTIAGLPRKQMAAHCERALALLDIGDILGASGEMEKARQLDFDADPVTLGPDVEDDILDARLRIEKGESSEAVEAIEGVLERLKGSDEEKALSRALASVKAARDALRREAFNPAQAEIAVAQGALASLKEQLQKARRPSELLPAKVTQASQEPKETKPATPPAPAPQPSTEPTEEAPEGRPQATPGAASPEAAGEAVAPSQSE
ncbi:MAG: hypothetical protein ACE5O2_07635 [Armatimonadota bacterium]